MTNGKNEDEADRLRAEASKLQHEAHGLEDTAHKIEGTAHEMEDRAEELIERAEELGHEHGHGSGDGCGEGEHGGGHDHKGSVKLTVVVNGTPTKVEATKEETLGAVRKQALEQTNNLAQPPENWEIKTEAGDPIDPNKTVGDYHFGAEATLFLSLAAGIAGA